MRQLIDSMPHNFLVINAGEEYNIVIAKLGEHRFNSKVVNEWNMTPERKLELLLESNVIPEQLHKEVKQVAKETTNFLRKQGDILYPNKMNSKECLLFLGDGSGSGVFDQNKYAELEIDIKFNGKSIYKKEKQ